MLDVQDIHAYYGDSHVIRGVSLQVGDGEIVAVIGRNGVGKTTLLKTIVGLLKPRRGQIVFNGRNVSATPMFQRSRAGLAFVPEDRGIFSGLTVAENLQVPEVTLRHRRGRVGEARFDPFTAFPILAERRHQLAGSLSGGEQQMLAIGRVLAHDPALLLIDEFSEGVQPNIVEAIGEQVRAINRRGTAIMLVEQNARLALKISHRAYVLEKGQVVLSGPSMEFAGNEALLRKHLVM